ncbi:SMP-30/gluconolactonase/LRE family protein [Sulfitobacter mediterraneus]|uniref:SMP-30/gluconolactonase/LRE family protein n=1 Tax=Sulfitobacter mediterraneus TaxID=83219 RepID=UPI0021A70670|nr:SMP-30/gluconolactonase/LRE family protein [Sulfitobacter mediterraneus]UWR13330.1 SMP-30/gluconolactonase/LRE family protein [Sulfitobacter mediterraneus]
MTFSPLSHPMAITGESPLWDHARSCLWWIDIQAQRLLYTTMAGVTTAIPCPWQPGFVALAESGRLVVGLENGLWTFDPDGTIWEQISDTEADRPTLRLNDGKPDLHGRLWFGSMDMTGQGVSSGRLYLRETNGDIRIMREGITVPNAIVPLADGSGLYFADSPRRVLERLTLNTSGDSIVQSDQIYRFDGRAHPDGACLDADGNIWIALIEQGGVIRLSPNGQELARHSSPISRATMPMIGGPDGSTMFLTSQRRFLSPDELQNEPMAGGLLSMNVNARAATVHKVAGL